MHVFNTEAEKNLMQQKLTASVVMAALVAVCIGLELYVFLVLAAVVAVGTWLERPMTSRTAGIVMGVALTSAGVVVAIFSGIAIRSLL